MTVFVLLKKNEQIHRLMCKYRGRNRMRKQWALKYEKMFVVGLLWQPPFPSSIALDCKSNRTKNVCPLTLKRQLSPYRIEEKIVQANTHTYKNTKPPSDAL